MFILPPLGCTIDCEGTRACEYITIYSHKCDLVTVSTTDGIGALLNSTIYGPNGGDLLINIEGAGGSAFRGGTVLSNNTQNIDILHA